MTKPISELNYFTKQIARYRQGLRYTMLLLAMIGASFIGAALLFFGLAHFEFIEVTSKEPPLLVGLMFVGPIFPISVVTFALAYRKGIYNISGNWEPWWKFILPGYGWAFVAGLIWIIPNKMLDSFLDDNDTIIGIAVVVLGAGLLLGCIHSFLICQGEKKALFNKVDL